VCIMPVALTGVRVSGSAPITRLPTPTDVRLPLQMLQAPRSEFSVISTIHLLFFFEFVVLLV